MMLNDRKLHKSYNLYIVGCMLATVDYRGLQPAMTSSNRYDTYGCEPSPGVVELPGIMRGDIRMVDNGL